MRLSLRRHSADILFAEGLGYGRSKLCLLLQSHCPFVHSQLRDQNNAQALDDNCMLVPTTLIAIIWPVACFTTIELENFQFWRNESQSIDAQQSLISVHADLQCGLMKRQISCSICRCACHQHIGGVWRHEPVIFASGALNNVKRSGTNAEPGESTYFTAGGWLNVLYPTSLYLPRGDRRWVCGRTGCVIRRQWRLRPSVTLYRCRDHIEDVFAAGSCSTVSWLLDGLMKIVRVKYTFPSSSSMDKLLTPGRLKSSHRTSWSSTSIPVEVTKSASSAKNVGLELNGGLDPNLNIEPHK